MIETEEVKVGNFTFRCRVSGDKKHEPVVLLHGFPESSYMWIPLMEKLNAQGYYCIAPDLRGYSPEARPRGKSNYRIDKLAKDVADIASAYGVERFHLVGHDFGSAIGWQTTFDFADRVISWSGLSVPHIQGFFKAVVADPDQRKRSTYIRQFQIPFLPELGFKKNNYRVLRSLWPYQSWKQIQDYMNIFSQRRALTATLNYYRANYHLAKQAEHGSILGKITVPTLFIWGRNDFAIGPASVEECKEHVSADYQFVDMDSGHWIVDEDQEKVGKLVIGHIKKYSIA